jgi:glycosyltransferase involved in cell wall biosynthesis
VLVRLHGEPLAVVHVEGDPFLLGERELAQALGAGAGDQLRAHGARFGCVPPACELAGLGGSAITCPGRPRDRPQPSVAVIISTAGRPQQLVRCVGSLLEQTIRDLEVVVVDNRPDSGEVAAAVAPLAARDRRVRYVAEPTPGLSHARNRGVGETAAELVAFTDDDVVADPGWLAALTAPLCEPDVLAACGLVLPLELETEAQKTFERYAGFSKGLQSRRFDRSCGPAPGRLLYPFVNGSVGVGNNMAFRRAELLAQGGFDPALGAGSPAGSCEETWAFAQVLLSGRTIVYAPRALCWHEHRRDGAALEAQVFGYGTGLGALLAKAAIADRRFYPIAAGSLRIALAGRSDAGAARSIGVAPPPRELLRARRHGILRGPVRYLAGLRARRSPAHLDGARGRPRPG